MYSTYQKFINETYNNKHLTENIKNYIYGMVDDGTLDECRSCPSCPETGKENPIECHCVVFFLEDNLEGTSFYKFLNFLFWDESKWDLVCKEMEKDNMKFSNPITQNLYDSIKYGETNGHSFIEYEGNYIDPHLYDLGTPDEDIQIFCGYFSKFLK